MNAMSQPRLITGQIVPETQNLWPFDFAKNALPSIVHSIIRFFFSNPVNTKLGLIAYGYNELKVQ